jgi:hypothetical protein
MCQKQPTPKYTSTRSSDAALAVAGKVERIGAMAAEAINDPRKERRLAALRAVDAGILGLDVIENPRVDARR